MHETVIRQNLWGFTLLEMLVVVLIMGILVATISTRMQPGERDQLRVEATRLAQLLELATQEARLTGRSIVWTSNGIGYAFWRERDAGVWSQILDDDVLRARSLPRGMVIAGLRDEAGRAQPTLRLELGADEATSAFSLELSLGNERYAIAASPLGDLRMAPGAGKTYADMPAP